MKRTLLLFLLGLFGLLVVAGCTPSQPVPTPQTVIAPSPLPSQSATTTPSPTLTTEPTLDQNAILATNQAESLSKFATSKAVLTQLAITPSATPRPVASPTTIPTPFPTSTPIADDAFVGEMSEKGYSIFSAGSIQEGAYTYHAYLFVEPSDDIFWLSEPTQESWIIAFYRWDGKENVLMGTSYLSPYTKQHANGSFPVYARLFNWDNPERSSLGLDYILDPEPEVRERQSLRGYSSDINHNNRPEFMIVAQYCPVSCSRPMDEYHFFEITETGMGVDLAAGLPGHLSLQPYSVDPVVYVVSEQYWYGFFSGIYVPHYYEWRAEGFVEVTTQYKTTILTSRDEQIAELKLKYGQPFPGEFGQTILVSIPMIYQSLGMREEGLTLYLELSDPTNWPGTDSESLCWLQYSRAHFSDSFSKGMPFTIPVDASSLTFLNEYLQRMITPFNPETYDLTACYAILPDE